MAHFTELNDQDVVVRVVVANNTELLDQHGVEQEFLGVDFCQQVFGGRWIQTSYNASFRKNFAAVGFLYDGNRDAFVPPQPYNSWQLNEETCRWEAPIPAPEDGKSYVWDEPTTSWVAAT
jgi:hypothetical protein